MHIEYLYYFRDFSKTLSISKTAEKYFMTPQGLSRALHQMEKDFGIALMQYQNNVVSLTPAGKELSERAEVITKLYDDARGVLTEFKLAEVGSSNEVVRITVTSCAFQYLASMLELQKPGLFPFGVKMSESNLFRIVPSALSREGEDAVCLISLPLTPKWRAYVDQLVDDNGMTFLPMAKSPLVALVSTYSPLAKKRSISVKDIEGYPVARFRDNVLGDALDDFIKEDNVKTVTNAASIIFSQIMENQAVSFAPKLVEGMRILPESITTRPVKGLFDTEFGIMMGESERTSPLVAHMIDYIKSKLTKEQELSRYGSTFELLF